MDKPGFMLRPPAGQLRAHLALAQELERRGFRHVYVPSSAGTLSACLALAQATEQLEVGTGIAHIYKLAPSETALSAAAIHELSGGRFRLGLGVGHDAAVEWLDVPTRPPVAAMRAYVAQLRAAVPAETLPPLMLAALRRRMVRLAGEVADGVLLANAARSHLPATLAEIPGERREGFLVGNIAICAVADDRDAALAAVRRALRIYLRLPNYRRYFTEAGYGEEMARAEAALAAGDLAALDAAVSERLAADIALYGTAAEVREQIEAWQAAGVNRLTLAPLSTTVEGTEAIQEVAAALS